MDNDEAARIFSQSMTQEQQQEKLREDEVRRDMLRPGAVLGPHVLLTDVYANYGQFVHQDLSPEEAAIPRLFQSCLPSGLKAGDPSVVPQAEFMSKWEKFSGGMFHGLDWSNVFAAGGAVLACLMKNGEEHAKGSDIDLFVTGLTPEQANDKLRHIYEVISRNSGGQPAMIRTAQSCTILGAYPKRHVQIVLRLYGSPSQVLTGFDVDACTVGFDGEKVWVHDRAKRAINRRYMLVDLSRRSLTYEVRLQKYAKRGFTVMVPTLDQGRVHPSVRNADTRAVNGLGKLIAYDTLVNQGRDQPRPRFMSRGLRLAQYGRVDEFSKERFAEHQEVDSDYSDVWIPWGPRWARYQILRLLKYRDRAQYFSKDPNAHRHIYVDSTRGGIDAVLAGTSCWCKICRQRGAVGTHLQETGDDPHQVRGPLHWRTDNPGGQMLSGSFHPLPAKDWDVDAYKEAPPAPVPQASQRVWKKAPKMKKKKSPKKKAVKSRFGGFGWTGSQPAPSTGFGGVGGGFGFGSSTGGFVPPKPAQQAQSFGAPSFGQATQSFGQPAQSFGAPSFGQPAQSFGAPSFGQATQSFGQPAQSFGAPSFGQPTQAQPAPTFGQKGDGGWTEDAWAQHKPASFSELSQLFSGLQVADMPSSNVGKALLLISTVFKGGKISESEKRILKEMVLTGRTEQIFSVVQCFQVDKDFDDLASSFSIIAKAEQ